MVMAADLLTPLPVAEQLCRAVVAAMAQDATHVPKRKRFELYNRTSHSSLTATMTMLNLHGPVRRCGTTLRSLRRLLRNRMSLSAWWPR